MKKDDLFPPLAWHSGKGRELHPKEICKAKAIHTRINDSRKLDLAPTPCNVGFDKARIVKRDKIESKTQHVPNIQPTVKKIERRIRERINEQRQRREEKRKPRAQFDALFRKDEDE